MASPTTQTNTAPLAAMENQTMEVENSGKIAANIRQLIAELERQIKEQSHENTTEFRIVITHEGAQVSQITSGPEYLRAKGLTALNLRGEKIA